MAGNTSGIMRCNESTGDPEKDLKKVLSLLESRGFDVLVVDLTTPDVREVGFRVVRVLIPGLQPLHGDHCYPFLGGTSGPRFHSDWDFGIKLLWKMKYFDCLILSHSLLRWPVS